MASCKVLLLLDGSDSHPKKWSFKATDIQLPDVTANLRDHFRELVRQRVLAMDTYFIHRSGFQNGTKSGNGSETML